MSNVTHNQTDTLHDTHSRAAVLCQVFAWALVSAVSFLAIGVWGHDYNWHILPIDLYVTFPLLGLLAYSIMWSHYMSGALRQVLGLPKSVLAPYFRNTSLVVLALICLHPSLLIYQRFRDGYGFPPHSYETYVAPGLGWITLLGSFSLLVFLAYELRRFYSDRAWWKYMQPATDIAMLAIFYHALRLGHQLHPGLFHTVWLFYGVTLVGALIYNYTQQYRVMTKRPTSKN